MHSEGGMDKNKDTCSNKGGGEGSMEVSYGNEVMHSIGGTHGQGASMCTPIIKDEYKDAHIARGAAAACSMVGMGCIHMRSSLGVQIEVCTALGQRVYMAYSPHLKSPSLLYMDFSLEPTKCFAWNFRG